MRLVKNIFFNGSVQISGILINLIMIPYIARVLGKEALGINSFGQAVASYFVLLGTLGITIYGARSIAERRDNVIDKQQKFSQCITFQFFFSTIAILLFNIWVLFQGANSTIYFLFNLILFTSMTDLSWAYTGMERFDLIAVRNISIKVIGTLFIFVFVKKEQDLFLYIIIQYGVIFISNVVFWLQLKKIGLSIAFSTIGNSLKNTLRPALTLFIPSIFTVIYLSLNKVMLGYLSSIGEVAIYDYPNRLVRIAITLIGVIGTVMMPRLSYLKHSDKTDDFKIKINQLLYGSMIFSIPVVYTIIITATLLCDLFFTSSFTGSDDIMRIIAPTIFLSGLSLYVIFVSTDKVKYLTKAVAVGSVINIILNFILIPLYHAKGAAISTIVTEVFVHLFLLYYLRRVVSVVWLLRNFFIIAVLGSMPYLLLFRIDLSENIVQLLAVTVTYFLLYFILILIFQKRKIEEIFFNGNNLFHLLTGRLK